MKRRVALLMVLGCLLICCSSADHPPNIVVITIDTLRADHLGTYGYQKPVSPVIDTFAAGATVFENAFAQAPHTIPSLLEIMTSKYRQGLEIAAKDPTLAEVLQRHGYRTAAVVDNALLELDPTARGLMRGFDSFYRNGVLDRDVKQQHWKTKTPADAITAQAIRWLKRQDRSTPVFLWLHYFDPHDPYLPPFADDLETLSHNSGSPLTGDIRNSVLFEAPESDAARNLPQKDRDYLVALYDAEIRYVDQSLGDLFEFLKRERLYDDHLIALTADHGESFGEHGIWMHGFSLYQPEIHVPLIIKYPQQDSGQRVGSPVQTIDLFPTVLGTTRAAGEGLALDGFNLRLPLSEPAFAFWGPWQLVATDEWKMVQRGKKAELYRYRDDPAELRDMAAQQPGVVSTLQAAARSRIARIGTSPQKLEKLSTETVERMRALGYLKE